MRYKVSIQNSNTGTMYFEDYHSAKFFFDCTCLGLKENDHTNVFLYDTFGKYTIMINARLQNEYNYTSKDQNIIL